ncbi:MAG: hypothetical protein H7296_14295 [Bacteroidia bacterium]|nr:hypothetical protein [Bacteroidia bacterium]
MRNLKSGMPFLVDHDTSLRDFYYYYKPENENLQPVITNRYENLSLLEQNELKKFENQFYYELHFSNKGGLVMPLIIKWTYKDGTEEVEYINAYIWRKNENKVTKIFAKDKEVTGIMLDPFKETADIDETNNTLTALPAPTRFEVFKNKANGRGQNFESNPMKKQLQEKK